MGKGIKNVIISSFVVLCSLYSQLPVSFMVADSALGPIPIKLDSKKNIHAVWTHYPPNTSERYIHYAMFDTLGRMIKAPINLSDNMSSWPTLEINNDVVGVVWETYNIFGETNIKGRVYSISNDSLTDIIKYNQSAGIYGSPSIAYLTDSSFVITWNESKNRIVRQFTSITGQFIGEKVTIYDHDDVRHSRVIHNSKEGRFAVIWQVYHNDSINIYGQQFYSDGVPKDSSFLISNNPQVTVNWGHEVACSNTGDYAVVWAGQIDSVNGVIQVWRFDSNEQSIGQRIQVNSTMIGGPYPTATVDIDYDEDGTFIVVWEQDATNKTKIFAQRYRQDGLPLGGNFQVDTYDDSTDQIYPDVILEDGKIYVTWETAMLKDDDFITTAMAKIIDFNSPYLETDNSAEIVPQTIHLYQNYPNPFNPETTIQFQIKTATFVKLEIVDLLGRQVKTLLNDQIPQGLHKIKWNGTDSQGKMVPSGVYFYQVKANRESFVKKMALIR